MFYSIEHLIKREGRFALIWRLATRPSTRKGIDRGQIQSLDISALCEAILNHIPTSRGAIEEPRSKFSLYLIGQLLYGVVVVLDRKATYLELDARSAYEACLRLKKISFDEIVMNLTDKQEKSVKKKRRISGRIDARKTNDLSNVRFEMEDINLKKSDYFGDLDGVGEALRSQITLTDPVPDFRSNALLFNEEDLIPPNEEERNELNGSSLDRRESNSDEPRERLTRITDKTTMSEVSFPQPPFNESRPPGFEFEDLNIPILDTPLADQFPDMTTTLQPDQGEQLAANAEEPRVGADGSQQLVGLKRPADTVHLDPTADIMETPRKKRRKAIFVDNHSSLPWEEVKENVADFSSLVRPIEEVCVKKAVLEEPSVNDLLRPLPISFKIPAALHHLFQVPMPQQKMTLDEAANINPRGPTERGPVEKLWRYEGSTDESNTRRESIEYPPLDENLQLPGIAFIDNTPERFKEAPADPYDTLHNVQSKEFSTMNGGNLTLPPLPELDVLDIQQHEIGRRSQLSGIEEARRSTFGPQSSRHENRTRSLLAPNIEMDFGFAGFTENAKVVDVSNLSSSRLHLAKTKIVEALEMTDGGPLTLQQLFPPETTSRKSAARAFSALLAMLKTQDVTVAQSEAYGALWISGTERPTEESGMSQNGRDSTLSI